MSAYFYSCVIHDTMPHFCNSPEMFVFNSILPWFLGKSRIQKHTNIQVNNIITIKIFINLISMNVVAMAITIKLF